MASLVPSVLRLLRQRMGDAVAADALALMQTWNSVLLAAYTPLDAAGAFTLLVTVSELPITVRITAAALTDVYVPLLVLMHVLQSTQVHRRVLVGFVASAGAGKTTFTQILRTLYARIVPSPCACVSMDAYHVTNAQLDATGLRAFKGRIDTIDAAAFARDLKALALSGDAPVSLPVYDRAGSHDPVPDAMTVTSERIVLVEGLYLCAAAQSHAQDGIAVSGDWAVVRQQLDLVIALCIPADVSASRVIARKVSCGRSLADATAHYARVDAPVSAFVASTMQSQTHGPDLLLGLHVPDVAPDDAVSASIALTDAVLRLPSPTAVDDASASAVSPAGYALVLGLNACVQRTLVFHRGWARDAVNRADVACVSAGGKGQHTAIALARHAAARGHSAIAHVALVQMLGGSSGRTVAQLVRDAIAPPLHVQQVTLQLEEAQETRTCVTLLDSDMTECVEPAKPVSTAQASDLLRLVNEHADERVAAAQPLHGVALMGTTPPGAEGVFEAVLRSLDACHKLTAATHVLMDAHKGVSDILRTGLVTILKVNAEELRVVADSLDPSRTSKLVAVTACSAQASILSDLSAVMAALPPPNRCNVFVVTHGAGAAVLAVREPEAGTVTVVQYSIPDVRVHAGAAVVLSPIGAGDTVAGVFLSELMLSGRQPSVQVIAAALKWGLACASASVLTLRGAEWDPAVAVTLRDLISYTTLVCTLPPP